MLSACLFFCLADIFWSSLRLVSYSLFFQVIQPLLGWKMPILKVPNKTKRKKLPSCKCRWSACHIRSPFIALDGPKGEGTVNWSFCINFIWSHFLVLIWPKGEENSWCCVSVSLWSFWGNVSVFHYQASSLSKVPAWWNRWIQGGLSSKSQLKVDSQLLERFTYINILVSNHDDTLALAEEFTVREPTDFFCGQII